MENWIHLKFMKYLNDNKLPHEKQSGFRAGHLTESALIRLIDSWLKAINESKFVGCVMIDFQKAFNLVDHAVLLWKLKYINVGKVLYLGLNHTFRKCPLSIQNLILKTKLAVIHKGLFLDNFWFINDLPLKPQNIVASTDLYADATTIYVIQNDKQVFENNLQKSLVRLQQWCKENGM